MAKIRQKIQKQNDEYCLSGVNHDRNGGERTQKDRCHSVKAGACSDSHNLRLARHRASRIAAMDSRIILYNTRNTAFHRLHGIKSEIRTKEPSYFPFFFVLQNQHDRAVAPAEMLFCYGTRDAICPA